jgi:hypothetical protein
VRVLSTLDDDVVDAFHRALGFSVSHRLPDYHADGESVFVLRRGLA